MAGTLDTSLLSPLAVGTILAGRFELLEHMGSGTFGDVWRAADARNPHEDVAIKLLKPAFLCSDRALKRFEEEGRALELLNHRNVVRVIERGEWRGLRYIVTEYVSGTSLEAWLECHRRQGTAPDMPSVLDIFDQVCAGVAAAHQLHAPGAIVHRDLKPGNIMLSPRADGGNKAVVLDFGLACQGDHPTAHSGDPVGTPGYTAPEQLTAAQRIGPWTDVFALGVLLVEMLTFRITTTSGEHFWWVAARRDQDLLAGLGEIRSDISPGVWQVIRRALKDRIEDRYQDADAVRQALRQAVCGGSEWPTGARPQRGTAGMRRWSWVGLVCGLGALALSPGEHWRLRQHHVGQPQPSRTTSPTPPGVAISSAPPRTPVAQAPAIDGGHGQPRTAKQTDKGKSSHDRHPRIHVPVFELPSVHSDTGVAATRERGIQPGQGPDPL